MELDDLRNIWKKNEGFKPKLEEEIAGMLKGKSQSIVAKIRRSVWFELIFTVIAGLVLLYYSFVIHAGALRWSFIAFLILFLGYIIYYVKKINLLNRFEGSHGNIKMHLENLVADLDAYLKFYKKSYSLLYPIYFILILSFVAVDRGMDGFIESFRDLKMILYLIFLLGVFLASSLWFTNWYLKKLYGDHLDKLKELLDDIKRAEPENGLEIQDTTQE